MVMFVWHLISIACALIWPILFCFFASWAIDHVSNIRTTMYDSNWYDYPSVELRKYVILVIARSQENFKFSGFGLIGCSVEVFGIVCIHTNFIIQK